MSEGKNKILICSIGVSVGITAPCPKMLQLKQKEERETSLFWTYTQVHTQLWKCMWTLIRPALHEYATKQASVHTQSASTVHRSTDAETPGSYCTIHTLLKRHHHWTMTFWPKNVYFSTQECGCYFSLTQKLCLYFNTQGLCVTELLFRGFLAYDCCVKYCEIQLALLCFHCF